MDKRIAVVVDDEALVADILGEQLEMLDFQPLVFVDPRAAFDCMVNEKSAIALLVTDYNMPFINGAELARETKRLVPAIKTVCVSGYLKNEVISEIRHFDGFLEKPFSYEQLRELVDKILPG